MNIEVLHSPAPRDLCTTTLQLAEGATVSAALQTLADDAFWASLAQAARDDKLSISLWGRRVGLTEALSEGDRLELCRGLLVDPKVARRERFKSQGTKSAGLFSKRRPGAKAGY